MRQLMRLVACLAIACVSASCWPFLGFTVPAAPARSAPALQTPMPSDAAMCVRDILRLVPGASIPITPEVLARTVLVMQHRALLLGGSVNVAAYGTDEVSMILPDGHDLAYLRQKIGVLGTVVLIAIPDRLAGRVRTGSAPPPELDGAPIIDGSQITGTQPGVLTGTLQIDLTARGAGLLRRYAGPDDEMQFGLVFNGVLLEAPTVSGEAGTRHAFMGPLSDPMIGLLTIVIPTGPLPVGLQVVGTEHVPCGVAAA
jgi:hypothetical protein